ncbi:hypothetical protein [Spirosoma flavum]|uniref:Uncharacterized protein n=1 Tax=Spirosoma flavum TaxID=2048557 RepID=A0ABW6AIX8_9BACT
MNRLRLFCIFDRQDVRFSLPPHKRPRNMATVASRNLYVDSGAARAKILIEQLNRSNYSCGKT